MSPTQGYSLSSPLSNPFHSLSIFYLDLWLFCKKKAAALSLFNMILCPGGWVNPHRQCMGWETPKSLMPVIITELWANPFHSLSIFYLDQWLLRTKPVSSLINIFGGEMGWPFAGRVYGLEESKSNGAMQEYTHGQDWHLFYIYMGADRHGPTFCYEEGAGWLSGRMLDSWSKGPGFESKLE